MASTQDMAFKVTLPLGALDRIRGPPPLICAGYLIVLVIHEELSSFLCSIVKYRIPYLKRRWW